jgi:hypothetical protein
MGGAGVFSGEIVDSWHIFYKKVLKLIKILIFSIELDIIENRIKSRLKKSIIQKNNNKFQGFRNR